MEGYLRKIKSLPKNVNKLSVWDIDDTLFTSKDLRIFIIKNNQIVKELSTSEWNHYRLKPGESPDFSQFRDSSIFFHSAKPLSKNLRTAKAALESKDTMMITLTARSKTDSKDLFLQKFKKYGIDMNKSTSHSVFAGELGMTTAKAKAHILDACLASKKFNAIYMYDDHRENLTEFLKLKTKYKEVDFNAFVIDSSGKIVKFG
jgi:hypothetical protein